MERMTVEQANKVLDELIRRFDLTIPTPMNHRGESTMRIEHFVDLSHEAKQALTTLRAELDGLRADAGRYRYAVRCGLIFLETDKDEVDAAIDAARQEKGHE